MERERIVIGKSGAPVVGERQMAIKPKRPLLVSNSRDVTASSPLPQCFALTSDLYLRPMLVQREIRLIQEAEMCRHRQQLMDGAGKIGQVV